MASLNILSRVDVIRKAQVYVFLSASFLIFSVVTFYFYSFIFFC
jgi:hypothetical protein